jgi:uncharacterized protein (TIGR00251 family)
MQAVKQTPEGIVVMIEVSPQSDKFQLTGYNTWRKTLEVKIKAQPTRGKANREIVQEFSRLTGRKVEIITGYKSRQKTLKIYGSDRNEFLEILKELKLDFPEK